MGIKMQFGGGLSEADIVRGKRTLKNGAVAGYVNVDGQEKWRIVKGVSAAKMAGLCAKRSKVPLSRADAKKAFEKHYRRSYMNNDARRARHSAKISRKHPELTEKQLVRKTNASLRRAMAAAKSRDINHELPKKKVITDRRYARKGGPQRYDYKGLDDGMGVIVHRGASEKQKAAARKNIQKARAARGKGGRKNQNNQNQRQNNQNRNQNQQGGQRPVSLKTAVKLLRDYYREAY